MKALSALLLCAFIGTPAIASAFVLTGVPALLINTSVGIYLAIILLMFGVAVGMYFGRLGTWPSNRDDAIILMEWVVVMLFALVLVVAAQRFIEQHTDIAAKLFGVLAFLLVLRYVVPAVFAGGEAHAPEKPKKEEKKG